MNGGWTVKHLANGNANNAGCCDLPDDSVDDNGDKRGHTISATNHRQPMVEVYPGVRGRRLRISR
ncbi:hypothetical protein GCM10023191_008980 [Actinoallomurus oryzae]|uniref:Uncharacterized protein n=1 Tax=Actinoallomurus oryzae TaxID=502180 RepID=A0ABP8PER4_9ACTN